MTASYTRNHYDSIIPYLFISGKEHLLSADLLKSIPYSTKATFKTYSINKYFGYEQRGILNEGIRTTELYQKYKHLKKVLKTVECLYIALSNLLDGVKTQLYQVKENKELILNLIQKHKDIIGLDKLLQIFKISRSTYQSWLLEIKVKCSASYFEQCVRRYGFQLLKSQVELIKETLTSNDYIHWPVASIAYYFQRQNLLHASVNTWYKYSKLLGIKRRRFKKSIKKTGIVSTRPNEYWHIDITYFTTLDGVKHSIYFLSDNFSRKILAWRLATEVSWLYVKECIEDAYTIASKMEKPINLVIVADGGPENIHHSLNEFINSLVGNINISTDSVTKVIALKDITFSNSPAEAKNKTFKMYYADPKTLENTTKLIAKIKEFINDFNNIRPMQALKGFTPHEVYVDKKPEFDFIALRHEDAAKRKESHKNNPCKACEVVLK
jgi:putative transposase